MSRQYQESDEESPKYPNSPNIPSTKLDWKTEQIVGFCNILGDYSYDTQEKHLLEEIKQYIVAQQNQMNILKSLINPRDLEIKEIIQLFNELDDDGGDRNEKILEQIKQHVLTQRQAINGLKAVYNVLSNYTTKNYHLKDDTINIKM
jgi:hypothetical protein